MIDLHMHTTYSDGTDTLEKLIDNVIEAGINFFAITDHDTAKACRKVLRTEELKQKIINAGIKFVCGIEYSCIYKGRKVHILAYDIDPNHESVKRLEQKLKDLFKEKDYHRSLAIEKDGYKFSEESKEFLKSRVNIRTPDVARCLFNDGYFDDFEDACQYVKKIKYPKEYLFDAVEVIEEMTKIGAKAVWAHAFYGLNQSHITGEKVDEFITELKPYGLCGLECYYSLYNKEEIDELLKLAKKHNLYITCGSDYHGKNKKIQLLERSVDGTETNEEDIDIINTFNNIIG